MKSLSPLSAVMLTTVFFLCSTVLFTKISSQEMSVSSTGLPSPTELPLSTGSLAGMKTSDKEPVLLGELQLGKGDAEHKPDPMFNSMFVPENNISQMIDEKVKLYEGRVKQVEDHSLVNDPTTMQATSSNGSDIPTGGSSSVTKKTTATIKGNGTTSIVGSEAPLKQPRSLIYRWICCGVSGFLLFLICILLCWEQCCQSPHY